MKKQIGVSFHRFWPTFDIIDFRNLFSFMSKDYEFIQVDKNPDFIFHSSYIGSRNVLSTFGNKPNIFYQIEDWIPKNLNDASFIIHPRTNLKLDSSKYLDLPSYWFQIYILGRKIEELIKSDKSYIRKDNFCNFIYKVSNPKLKQYEVRNKFYLDMSKEFGFIHCPGKSMNNSPSIDKNKKGKYWRHYNKLNYIKNFKYTITFENHWAPGYITEKLIDPMLVGSIPIYWGAPKISEYHGFNKKSFIYVNDFKSNKEVINKIKRMSKGDYERMSLEPWFIDNKIPWNAKEERVYNFVNKVLKNC